MIKVGDTVPEAQVMVNSSAGPHFASSTDILGAGKSLLIGVPGAFTPVCSDHHLPGLVRAADELTAKGIEKIVVVSVNDVFVMSAWAASADADGRLTMMADPDARFTRAMGLETDASPFGLGVRSSRYAAVIENGTLVSLDVEHDFVDHDVSSAEAVLSRL